MNEDIFNSFDNDNDSIISCLDNENDIDNEFLKYILNSKFFNKKLLVFKNNVGRTPVFNFMNLKRNTINYFFENNYLSKEMLKIQDIYGNSCLHITERTNELSIKKIIR